jgi:prevent-host-death family protein
VATTIPQRELRNDIGAVLRRVEAGEEFVVTVSGRPVAELRPVVRRRRFVPTEELFAALLPPAPLSPEVLAGLREVDALVESMDDGDDRFLDP